MVDAKDVKNIDFDWTHLQSIVFGNEPWWNNDSYRSRRLDSQVLEYFS